MPERPALIFPRGQPRERATRPSPRPGLRGPGADTQRRRLGPALERLTRAFESGTIGTTNEPAASPERVLVLEVAGELDDFASAVARIPGLEFLAEEAEQQLDSDADFKAVDHKGREHRYARQLFLIASDATAWQELLGFWERFQRGDEMPYGFAKFRDLFSRLRVLRAWNDEDRLTHAGALDTWERELAGLDREQIEFEVELWLRHDPARREQATADLRADLERAGGAILAASVRPEISYHGVLARVPAGRLLDAVARHEVRWMRTGDVRFFRPAGQFAAVDLPDRVEQAGAGGVPAVPDPDALPRIALLDGVPVAGHEQLRGRLIVDDPDGWESIAPVERRVHGTGMASIVAHGDLEAPGVPQPRPIYVRPILISDAPAWVNNAREELPRNRLPVDLLRTAVSRLFEGETVAPSVKIIVLAVGDAAAQFDRFVSPLARMLDWLAHRYSVLVLVSAGNHLADLELDGDLDLSDVDDLQHEVLCTLHRERGFRRLLSPAEAANAITVGSAHSDATGVAPTGLVDPLLLPSLPSVTSAMGGGIRRAVKPDVLLAGGRQLLRAEPRGTGDDHRLSIVETMRPPGIRVAAPGSGGRLDRTTYGRGTSPATALAGYHAGLLVDDLEALRERHGDRMPDQRLDSVLTKAALAHSASWGSAGAAVDAASQEVFGQRSRDNNALILGYGLAEPRNALRCDDHRVTLLAAGRIEDGMAHPFRFPLPPSLASATVARRLTLTLAWLTPINAEHRGYRRAALTFEPTGLPPKFAERTDLGAYGGRRGTVQHEILKGAKAVPFAAGAAIEFVVSCRADAGSLDEAVPYAAIATLEVPATSGLQIYQEVQAGIRPVIKPRAR